MRGVRAPTVEPRTPHTGGHPRVGRVVRRQRRAASAAQDRTIPPSLLAGCHVIQREHPQPVPGISHPRSRRSAGHSGPPRGSRG
jgi:hypothetical protein